MKTLQEKIKQLKQKTVEESEEGPGAEKPIVEEVIKEDRVRLFKSTAYCAFLASSVD